MTAMLNERDLLWQSLPPVGDAEWADYEKTFLGKTAECPPTAELICYAENRGLEPAAAGKIRQHLPGCRFCSLWVESYRQGLEEDEADLTSSPPRPGSLLDVYCSHDERVESGPSSCPPPPLPPQAKKTSSSSSTTATATTVTKKKQQQQQDHNSSMVLTGFATLIKVGRMSQALEMLHPHLPDILEAVGLDPDLAGQLREFIQSQLEDDPNRASSPISDWLQSFAREELRHPELLRNPEPEEWRPWLARGAFERVKADSSEPAVQEFLQEALNRQMDSPEGLELLRAEDREYEVKIPAHVCRELIRKVRQQQGWMSRAIGLNLN